MLTTRYNKAGFSIVEVMVVVTMIGILLSISIPAFIRAREKARQTACQQNLIQIDGAVERWVLSENIPTGAPITVGLDYLVGEVRYLRTMPICPTGGTYEFFNVDDNPPIACSIGFSVERAHVLPQQLDQSGS